METPFKINYLETSPIGNELNVPEKNIEGRNLRRKSIASDKLLSPVDAATIGKTELKYETATLVFGATDTVKTATITTGSIIFGWYASAYTTPANSWLKLEISGTTLTGTLTVAPGTSNSLTITIILIKV